MEESTTTKEVTVLRTGDGEIRVGVNLGYSMEIKGVGVYVKPSIYLEVPVPVDEELDEYIDKVINYLSPKLKEIERRIMRMAGFVVGDNL